MSSESLPELTEKQQIFKDALLEGMTGPAAYRKAFNTENMSTASISVEATRLKRHPKIAPYLQSARQIAHEDSAYTLKQHLDDLKELRDAAVEANQMGPAVAATEKMGRVLGMYIEKHEDVTQGDDIDLLQAIEQLFGKDMALKAKAMMGYETEH